MASAIALAAVVAPAIASETTPDAVTLVVDCGHRALPSQREVGDWSGERNFGQAYAARQRLVAKIMHACRRSGIEQVQLTLRAPDAERGTPLLANADDARSVVLTERTP